MPGESVLYQGSIWTIIYGEGPGGGLPVRDFLEALEEDDRLKTKQMLASHAGLDVGNFWKSKKIKKFEELGGGVSIWEFKLRRMVGGIRLLFVTRSGCRIVLVDGFVKKEDEADPAAVDRAQKVRANHLKRHPDVVVDDDSQRGKGRKKGKR